MRRAPARPVRACFVRSCCTDVVQEHDLRTTPAQCNAKRTLSSHFTVHSSPCTLHSTLHLTSNHVSSSHLISALLISPHLIPHVIKVSSSQLFSSHPSTDQPFSSPRKLILAVLRARKLLLSERRLLHKNTIGRGKFLHTDAFKQKSLSEILCTTKLAQSTSQYYFVLQSLHKVLSHTTLYYKACTKHVPVLLCTTRLAQSTSQYYFVLQSLHEALPSTTLYYEACASTSQHYLGLCTTRLAQSMSQYFFALQSLHKALPSTTLYYEACASTSQY